MWRDIWARWLRLKKDCGWRNAQAHMWDYDWLSAKSSQAHLFQDEADVLVVAERWPFHVISTTPALQILLVKLWTVWRDIWTRWLWLKECTNAHVRLWMTECKIKPGAPLPKWSWRSCCSRSGDGALHHHLNRPLHPLRPASVMGASKNGWGSQATSEHDFNQLWLKILTENYVKLTKTDRQ